MSFFDKALTGVLDGIERNVVDQVREAAAAALEEYPGQDAPTNAILPAEWDKAAKAISYWRLFNLEGRKAELQDQLARIASEKASRDKSAPSLIRRAEEAELALAELCNRLLQAPDVVPYLCEGLSAQETIKELQKEKRRLQKHTEAAEKEATSAVSAVGQVQRAEAARVEVERRLEEESAKVAHLQQELAGSEDLTFRCARLEADLGQTRGALQSLQAEYQSTQNELFELRNRRESDASATANDADLAALEHEQALKRIRTLEHELRRNHDKLQQVTAECEAKLAAVPEEAAASRLHEQLLREVHRLQAGEQEAAARTEEWQERITSAERQAADLQDEMKARLSLEEAGELRDRLRTAEALLDAQMAAEAVEPSSELEASSPANSLISTLQIRNRRLVADNNSLRQRIEAAEQRSSELRDESEAAKAEAGEQKALAERLEQDLLASLEGSRQRPAESSGSGQPPGSGGAGLLQIVTSQRDRFRKRVEELEEEAEEGKKAAGNSESRIQALEKDNLGLYERIKYLQRFQAKQPAAAAFKIVSVDDAGVPQPSARSLSHRMSCGPLQLHLGAAGDAAVRSRNRSSRFSCLGGEDWDEETAAPKSALEERYSKAYQSKINPFVEFQANEREGKLPTHERALLSGSKLLLSNRAGRAFAVVYLVALHLFLFCLVYYIIVASMA